MTTTVGAWLATHPDLERLDRELLVGHAAGLSRAQVLARPERPLDNAAADRLGRWAARRRAGEPLAYILGVREFWGLEIDVSPAVLVPRPETELLVEVSLHALWALFPRGCQEGGPRGQHSSHHLRVLDLGTGSGAIAVALARELGGAQVTATDVSPEALAVAARNAERHDARITWIESDWFERVAGRFHLIVSNPPYVAQDDPHLVHLAHEPHGALVAGPDGLDAIRRIVAGASDHLEEAGVLALEHGSDQGAAVRALLVSAGFTEVTTCRDLAGLERVTRGRLEVPS